MTITYTLTSTPINTITSSVTDTMTPNPTPTSTPVITPTPGSFEINNVVIYPNPFHPGGGLGATLGADITQDAESLTIKIYTTGFRAVREIVIPGIISAGRVNAHVNERDIGNLANGIYYYTVTGESAGNTKAKALPGALIILR